MLLGVDMNTTVNDKHGKNYLGLKKCGYKI